MLVMFVLMITQIVLRTFFGSAIRWSDELLRYLFIWLVFLGLPSAIHYKELTRFDVLEKNLGTTGANILNSIIDAASIVVMYLVATGAMTMVEKQMKRMATTMKLPMGIVYTVIPFTAIASILFLAFNIYLRFSAAKVQGQGGSDK